MTWGHIRSSCRMRQPLSRPNPRRMPMIRLNPRLRSDSPRRDQPSTKAPIDGYHAAYLNLSVRPDSGRAPLGPVLGEGQEGQADTSNYPCQAQQVSIGSASAPKDTAGRSANSCDLTTYSWCQRSSARVPASCRPGPSASRYAQPRRRVAYPVGSTLARCLEPGRVLALQQALVSPPST